MLFVAATACRTSSAPAPTAAVSTDSGAFVVTLGNDTLSAESFRRKDGQIDGTILRRIPRVTLLHYTLRPAPTGLPRTLAYYVRTPSGEMLPGGARVVSVVFTPDSVFTEIRRGRDSIVARRVAAPNAYPDLDGAVSLYALPINALNRGKLDSARFTWYVPASTQGEPTPVVRRGANQYWIYSQGYPTEVTIDPDGRVASVDGGRTTLRIQSRRQDAINIAGLATRWAERERVGGPVTALSPRDSATWTIGGARVSVGYGRPAARGRRIFGPNGVLGDTLWRTGANQETKFYTDAPLSFEGRMLPAGTYSLMTLAIPGRYQLIAYNREREVRVPLESAPLSSPVERFTITIESSGPAGGTIHLRWDTMDLFAPFTVGARP